jgi:RecJ-like exonuclease
MQDFKGAELENYINPIMFGGSSDISAGFLTCLFAEAIAKVDVERLKEAALISDFSAYANNRNHEASKYATILDFVTGVKDSTHYLDGPLTPKYLSKLLEDKEKRDSIYSYANDLIEEAIKFGIEKSKEYKRKDGITINVIDFEHIAKKYSGYLLPGRYSSKLQGSLEAKSSNGNITIVTFRNYISIRLGKKIAEKVRLLDIIEELKATSGLVDSGGGHHEAASIRVYQENMASVINLLLNAFGAKA